MAGNSEDGRGRKVKFAGDEQNKTVATQEHREMAIDYDDNEEGESCDSNEVDGYLVQLEEGGIQRVRVSFLEGARHRARTRVFRSSRDSYTSARLIPSSRQGNRRSRGCGGPRAGCPCRSVRRMSGTSRR